MLQKLREKYACKLLNLGIFLAFLPANVQMHKQPEGGAKGEHGTGMR